MLMTFISIPKSSLIFFTFILQSPFSATGRDSIEPRAAAQDLCYYADRLHEG